MTGLSQSSLGVFKDCPRCFWLEKRLKVKRPRGIKASIMDGIDQAMKQSVLAALVDGTAHKYLTGIPGAGVYPDRTKLESFRNWRTFQATVTRGKESVLLWGELDELIVFPKLGVVAPWDFKSNGQVRDWVEYVQRYYQLQADMYDVLLSHNGLVTSGKAYFTFEVPFGSEASGIEFKHATIEVATNPERAIDVAFAAVDCLSGSMPPPSVTCEYCSYTRQHASVMSKPTGMAKV